MRITRRICFTLFAVILPCTLFFGCGGDPVAPAQEEDIPWKDPAKQIELLDSGDSLIKRIAASNLGRMGSEAKDAIPALEKLKEDPDPLVKEAAEDALQKIQAE